MNRMDTALDYLKGIGPNRAQLLREELGLQTYHDLLHLFPNRYVDRSQFHPLNALPKNSAEIQIKGRVTQFKSIAQKRGSRLVATLEDSNGQIELVWFRGQKWIQEQIRVNKEYVVFGRLNWYGNKANIPHPELTLVENFEQNAHLGLHPIYPSTEKLTQRGISQKVIKQAQQQLYNTLSGGFSETLPPNLIQSIGLTDKNTAYRAIHFPENHQQLSAAQLRLKFEELFYIQLQLLKKKQLRQQQIKGYVFEKVGTIFNTFFKHSLPFALTNAQKKVLKEIRQDLGTGIQMNRLLQGDVGSGKTIIALMSMLIGVDNGFQVCLMAPTEILAQQHFHSLSELLEGSEVRIALLTGSTKKADRTPLHDALQTGELHILVGTHAVLEDKVQFANLGLAIIDEQHRFGVAQRAKLWKKNKLPPHVLVMTATPIPRTLAMSLYGDLDVSIIDELPPGRKPVKTVWRKDSNRLKVFQFIKEEIKKGRQVYVVYPLIEESETLDYKDLMDGYESLQRSFPAPEYQISIVHGRMKPDAKEYEMQRFQKKQTQILIATTVIEVGVNIPNASVMIIESAERFGLSQLHQLRGRVGRGNAQSFCILMSGYKLSEESRTRLDTMVRTHDGFEIAEVDLRLRGPGDLMGTQQSGILQLNIANLVKDQDVLILARNWAEALLEKDPHLQLPEHQGVKASFEALTQNKALWKYIS